MIYNQCLVLLSSGEDSGQQGRPEFDAKTRETDFFARHFTPATGAFLPGGHFVAVAHDAVKLFRIDNGGAGFVKNIESGAGAAVVCSSGEIRVYEI